MDVATLLPRLEARLASRGAPSGVCGCSRTGWGSGVQNECGQVLARRAGSLWIHAACGRNTPVDRCFYARGLQPMGSQLAIRSALLVARSAALPIAVARPCFRVRADCIGRPGTLLCSRPKTVPVGFAPPLDTVCGRAGRSATNGSLPRLRPEVISRPPGPLSASHHKLAVCGVGMKRLSSYRLGL